MPPAPKYSIDNAAWSGHHLILADEDLVDHKIRRPLLSPSVAAGYNNCPASVVVGRLQPWDDDPFAANTMGTAAHAVMEHTMELPAEERTRERAQALLEKEADQMWATSKLERRDATNLKLNAENRALWMTTLTAWIDMVFALMDPTQVEVDTTEFLLDNVEIGKGVGGSTGIPLKGYVDLTEWVTIAGARRRLIDDWKFGKAKVSPNLRYGDDYGDQQRIYWAGYTESTGESPAGARLIFPRGLEGIDYAGMPVKARQQRTIRNIDVSPDAVRKTLLGFRAGWETMNQSCDARKFEARPSGLCGWCPAANSCPVAKLSNDKAKDAAKKQPSALQLGIPTLRVGASLQEVRDAPGVSVPLRREPDRTAPIEPAGDDLFPITLLEDGETEESVRDTPAPVAEPAALADYPEPVAPPEEYVVADALTPEPVAPLDDVFEIAAAAAASDEATAATIPDSLTDGERTDQIHDAVTAVLANPAAYAHADDPFGSEPFGTVHVEGEGPTDTDRENTHMNEQHPEQPLGVKAEAAPYEETINGGLNLNSYSAQAVSGIVALAFEHMRSQGVQPGPVSLSKFAQVLTGIVLRTQKRMTGFANFQKGANSRLRGFLHMALDAIPAPFRIPNADGTALVAASVQDWEAWSARVEKLLTIALDTAVNLYDEASTAIPVGAESFFAAGGEGAPAPVANPVLVPTA